MLFAQRSPFEAYKRSIYAAAAAANQKKDEACQAFIIFVCHHLAFEKQHSKLILSCTNQATEAPNESHRINAWAWRARVSSGVRQRRNSACQGAPPAPPSAADAVPAEVLVPAAGKGI